MANNRGFPYLRKSEEKDRLAIRIRNKSWTDYQIAWRKRYEIITDKTCKE